MSHDPHSKVQSLHLKRQACLYIRQSTLRQVFENTESTQRQYALRQRAVALGWADHEIRTIDCDQALSGAAGSDREGFERLVTDVALGRVGIVMGLEVSRLARNSMDWHRLLELCALTDTLILDEDGIYDPSHFNDRLLLGLKGTMSEAELHVMRARLQGGLRSKARRGELWLPLPIGFVYGPDGRVVLDPDRQVQESVRHLFRTFQRTGSALATVKQFRKEALLFPSRAPNQTCTGELRWCRLSTSRALKALHNPRYAGVYYYGSKRGKRRPDGGRTTRSLPREEWTALIPDAHESYITWEEFEENLKRLRENSKAFTERAQGPAREGTALVQGLVVCGRCGGRMTVTYNVRKDGGLVPTYRCHGRGRLYGDQPCEYVPGGPVDVAIGQLLLEAVTPLSLEVALTVQHELQARLDQADKLRLQQVERARYEADLARRRYMQVDPENRLVADELEGLWNQKLRQFKTAQEDCERQRQADRETLNPGQTQRVMALATDFPTLWNDPATPQRERKRMARLILDDVTLHKSSREITIQARFRGGATRTLTVPFSTANHRQNPAELAAKVNDLLDHHTEGQVAALLNEQGAHSGAGKLFNLHAVRHIRKVHGLKSRYERLRERGLLTEEEMAQRLNVTKWSVQLWRRRGLLPAHAYTEGPNYLYEPPTEDPPVRGRWKGLSKITTGKKGCAVV